ncbi:hypothetical protein ACG7TL_001810 [Trametes sanguinea]
MPAIRTLRLVPIFDVDSDQPVGAVKKGPVYAGKLTKLRGELRSLIRNDLSTYHPSIVQSSAGYHRCCSNCAYTGCRSGKVTRRPKTVMHWTPHGYARSIVHGRGQWLDGWPNDPEGKSIPFGDPSSIPGGQRVISRLLDLWKLGILHFRPAMDAERRLAWRNPRAVLPGKPTKHPLHRALGPFGRNDIGRPRSQPKVFDADGKPVGRRWRRLGAITPKLCLEDEIVKPEEQLRSDEEVADSDPIEDWSDIELDGQ